MPRELTPILLAFTFGIIFASYVMQLKSGQRTGKQIGKELGCALVLAVILAVALMALIVFIVFSNSMARIRP